MVIYAETFIVVYITREQWIIKSNDVDFVENVKYYYQMTANI